MSEGAIGGSSLFIELGCAIVGLAVLARVANRWGFSAIPLYLLAGLAFGNGGLAPLNFSKAFVHSGAEIGVLLLLFMLGLEYTGEELEQNLRCGLAAGLTDFVLNFPPGLIAGGSYWVGSLCPRCCLVARLTFRHLGSLPKYSPNSEDWRIRRRPWSSPCWCWRIWRWL